MHYGVLGMKWGVRRYQNADGSLTAAGKKKISATYKKEADKVTRELTKNYNNMWLKAYNKSADVMNNGEIDRFNKEQEKKYGKDFAKRSGYEDDYRKMFEEEFSKTMNKSLLEFYDSNKNYQKAKSLVDKYGMEKWDDFAKSNADIIRELRDIVEKDN